MSYLEIYQKCEISTWSRMTDDELRQLMVDSWNLYIDGLPEDRRWVTNQMQRLRNWLDSVGKLSLWEEEFAAGKARLREKKRQEREALEEWKRQPSSPTEKGMTTNTAHISTATAADSRNTTPAK